MDNSSAEPGSDAGEPKSVQIEKAADQPSVSSGSAANPVTPESKEVTKVLAYGPAEREPEAPAVTAHHAPESGGAPEIKSEQNQAQPAEPDLSAKIEPVFGSALVPFIAKDRDRAAEKPSQPARPSRVALGSRGMQAAALAAFAGIAWAVAGSFYGAHGVKDAAPQTVAEVKEPVSQTATAVSDRADQRRLAEDIRSLKKELDGLRAAMAQNPAPEELRALKKSLDAVKNGLEASKSEMASSLAQLSAKLDRAQHDPAKLREISDRLDHIEHAPPPLTTASLAALPQETATKPAATAAAQAKAQPVTPQVAAAKQVPAQNLAAPPAPDKSPITGWVVRDVYDGIALVEGPHGAVEVIEGETIPGVGTVKSIERRGSGWIVVTSRGQLDSVRD